MNGTPGQPVRTPADEAATDLGVMLLAYAHRRHPNDRLAAVEEAFELLLNHVRALAAFSPRTLAETQDHLDHLRELERRRRARKGEPELRLADTDSEVAA